MSKTGIVFTTIGCMCLALLIMGGIYFGATPSGKATWNNWFHEVQEADDRTNYETKKHVEDACRAMISSYETDKLTYEQYKDSDVAEERSWAAQAKMRANKTANTYNNYILENNYVWADNVPKDIKGRLDIIK